MHPLGLALTLVDIDRPTSVPDRPGENPEVAYIRSTTRLLHSKFSDPNVLCPALAFLLERDNPNYTMHLITEDVHSTTAPTMELSLNNVLVIDIRNQIRVFVDLEWAPRFQLYHSTPQYTAFLKQLAPFFVGTEDVLENCIRDICSQMEQSMAAFGMPLPPWRTEAVIMNSYRELANAALGVLPLEAVGTEGVSPALSSVEEEHPGFSDSPQEALECHTPPLPIGTSSMELALEALSPHQRTAHPPEAPPLQDCCCRDAHTTHHTSPCATPVLQQPWTTADPRRLLPAQLPRSAGTGWSSCPHVGCRPLLPSEVRSVVDTVPTRRFCPASPGGESVDSSISFSFEKDLSYQQSHSCPSTPISTLATQLQGCPAHDYRSLPSDWPDHGALEPRARPPIFVLTSYPPLAVLH